MRERVTGSVLFVLLGMASMSTSASGQVFKIADMNTRQIQALHLEKTVAIIPGGILEEHGPYLPSFTDGYVTEAYVDALAKAIVARPGWSVVIFPQIPLGSDPANTIGAIWKFPGSYPVRTATARAIFMDLASDLGDQGFRWVFVVHNHGAPTNNKALDEAGDYFHETYGGAMVNLFGLMPVAHCCGVEAKVLSPEELGEEGVTVHSGADETSLLEFLRPSLLAPDFKQAVSWTSHDIAGLVANAKKTGWPGYFGAPRLASTAMGEQIFQQKSAKANEIALSILDGADARRFPRYGDVMLPQLQRNAPEALVHEREWEKREQDWLKAKGLE